MTLDLYTNPMSRGRIARWMLEEVGAPYETHVLDYGTTMKAPAFLAINPMGKVPAIVHDGRVVTECAAICAYLADAFPDAGLAPAPADRADYYRWLFFAAGPVEQAIVNGQLGLVLRPEQEAMAGYGSKPHVLDTLEGALKDRDYVGGPAFTAADVYVGSQVAWGLQFGTMDKRPAFEAYVARLTARPAYQRGNELDNALMPKQD